MPEQKNELQHNIFISWSGNRSRHVADALRHWLPMVLQAAKPFMSKADVDKGSLWHVELARVLEVTSVGIVCLTPESVSAPWLLFEAGALSKTLDRGTRVCTYLLAGLQPQQVAPPLGDFQATKAEKDETRQMLRDVNETFGLPISEQTLNDVFDLAWPKLEAALALMPKPEDAAPPKRTVEDMFGEILNLVRSQSISSGRAFTEDDFKAVLSARAGKVLMAAGAPGWSVQTSADRITYRINPRGDRQPFDVIVMTNTPLEAVEEVVKAQLPGSQPPRPAGGKA